MEYNNNQSSLLSRAEGVGKALLGIIQVTVGVNSTFLTAAALLPAAPSIFRLLRDQDRERPSDLINRDERLLSVFSRPAKCTMGILSKGEDNISSGLKMAYTGLKPSM